jgi:ADP-ribose pyrophosphatase
MKNVSLTIKDKKLLFQGQFTKLWGTNFLDKAGKKQVWEWVEKKDPVLIFPITNDDKIVLIKNFRVPLGKYMIEIPAGLLDKAGESVENAARRELLEETGYEAGELHTLKKYGAWGGITSMCAHVFIATGCKKTQNINIAGDDTEDITVIEIEADKLLDFYFALPEDEALFNMNILGIYEIAKAKGLVI